ncbi:hypothetical protein [Streptomyces mirabilis]
MMVPCGVGHHQKVDGSHGQADARRDDDGLQDPHIGLNGLVLTRRTD